MYIINLSYHKDKDKFVASKSDPFRQTTVNFKYASILTLEEARAFRDEHLGMGVIYELVEDIDGIAYIRPIGG